MFHKIFYVYGTCFGNCHFVGGAVCTLLPTCTKLHPQTFSSPSLPNSSLPPLLFRFSLQHLSDWLRLVLSHPGLIEELYRPSAFVATTSKLSFYLVTFPRIDCCHEESELAFFRVSSCPALLGQTEGHAPSRLGTSSHHLLPPHQHSHTEVTLHPHHVITHPNHVIPHPCHVILHPVT